MFIVDRKQELGQKPPHFTINISVDSDGKVSYPTNASGEKVSEVKKANKRAEVPIEGHKPDNSWLNIKANDSNL